MVKEKCQTYTDLALLWFCQTINLATDPSQSINFDFNYDQNKLLLEEQRRIMGNEDCDDSVLFSYN